MTTITKSPALIRHLRLFFVMTLSAGAAGCGEKTLVSQSGDEKSTSNMSLRQTIEELQGQGETIEIPVIELKRSSIHEQLSTTGELVPERSVIVKPLMDGQIIFMRSLEADDIVEEGELLAVIDDRDIRDDIRRQEQQIEITREKINIDRSSLDEAMDSHVWEERLHAQGFSSDRTLQASKDNVRRTSLTLKQTTISLDQERVKLDQSKRKLEKVEIRAPIGGMIVKASHLTGQDQNTTLFDAHIMEIDGRIVGTSTQICGIISHDSFLARCLLNGKDKPRVAEGQTVEVTIFSSPPVVMAGRVKQISNLQDVRSHAYTVWIALDDSAGSLTSGQRVRANIELAIHDETFVVDKAFIKERNNRTIVQVVQDGRVKNVEVQTGLSNGGRIELMSGVKLGDLLIASEARYEPGQLVNPVLIER